MADQQFTIQVLVEAVNKAGAELAQVKSALEGAGLAAKSTVAPVAAAEASFGKLRRTMIDLEVATTGGARGMAYSLASLADAAKLAVTPLTLAGGAAVLLGAGIVSMGVAFADNVRHLENVAEVAGTSVPNIQVLRQAMSDQGLQAESATRALAFLNKQIGENNPTLKTLGITTRDGFTALMQLADVLDRSHDAAANDAIMMALLGGKSFEMIAIMHNLRQKIADTTEQMGHLLSPDQIATADELHKNIDKMKDSFAGLWTNVEGTAAALLNPVFGAVHNILENSVPAGPRGSLLYGPSESLAPGGSAEASQKLTDLTALVEKAAAALKKMAKAADDAGPSLAELRRQALNAGLLPATIPGLQGPATTPQGAAQQLLKSQGLLDPAQFNAARSELEKLHRSFAQILADMGAVQAFGQAMADGMTQAFTNIAKALTDGTASRIHVLQTIMHDVIASVAQMLAQLAAQFAAYGFLRLLGTLIGGPIGGFFGAAAGSVGANIGMNATTGGGAATSSLRGGGNTYVINAINSKDVLQQLTSPTGSFRRASDRVAFVAAA